MYRIAISLFALAALFKPVYSQQTTQTDWIFPISSTWTVKSVTYSFKYPPTGRLSVKFNQSPIDFEYRFSMNDLTEIAKANAIMAPLLTAKTTSEVVNIYLNDPANHYFNAVTIGPQ